MIALAPPAAVTIWCPLLVVGRGLNDRLHWAVRARINKRERGQVAMAFDWFKAKGGRAPPGPYLIELVRVYSGREREMDDDNWISAAKSLRDQVAAELGVNDGNKAAVRFAYNQQRGEKTGVLILFHCRKEDE